VTDGNPDESWDDWVPELEDTEVERFKWGWNATDGESVWRVSGPGDGLPVHSEQLRVAWGREPSSTAGDVFGDTEYVPARASEPAVVVIHAYYGGRVPDAVVDWFREAFPDAQLRLLGGE